jgi:hypothetical protein
MSLHINARLTPVKLKSSLSPSFVLNLHSLYFSRYIGDALSLIKLDDFVDHIYPIKVEIKGTHIQLGLRHTLIYTLKNTMSVG